MDFEAVLISTAAFAMIAVVVAVVARTRQRGSEIRAEVQAKLIERFSSAPEFLSFIQTEEGKKFLGQVESAPKLNTRDRIIRVMARSLVVGSLGVGFLIIGFLPQTDNGFCVVAGFLLLTLGGGLFFSALLSLKLSRDWGLMDNEPPTNS